MFGGELRRRAIELVIEKKKKRVEVAKMMGMTRRTLYNWIEVYKKEGRTEPIATRTGPGQRRKLDPMEFKKFIDKNKGMSIQRMTVVLGVGRSAVRTAIRAIGYTRKKKQYLYAERKEKARAEFALELAKIPQKDRVFFDESGMNNNEREPYGWGKKGERVYDEKPGFASTRMSILAGLQQGSLRSPFILDGYCDREVVERYFKELLLPDIGPGKTIILDNASFHKGGQLKTIVESAACRLLYLPAYSPDLNPIEHRWCPVKDAIRAQLPATNYNLWNAAKIALKK